MGHEPGLHRRAVEALLLGVGHVDEVVFRRRVRVGRVVRRTEIELLLRAVVHLAHPAGHDAAEDSVAAVQHALAGAEVFAEQHLAGLAVLRLAGGDVGVVLPQEDGGVGQTEAIDALLHVAHGEQVLLLPGDGGEDAVLHVVGVLILVHHDLPVTLGHLLSQLRRLAVGLAQQVDGIVLLIGEIQRVAAGLLRLIAVGEVSGQCRQRQHGGRHGRQVGKMLRLGDGKGRGQLLQVVLALLDDGLHVLLFRVLAPDSAHAAVEAGQRGGHGVPVAAGGGKAPKPRCRLHQTVAVGGGHHLVGDAVCRFFQQRRPEIRLGGGVLHDDPTVGGLAQVLRQRLPAAAHLFQPFQRVGMALQLAVQLQHQLLQRPVVPARAQRFRQLAALVVHAGVEILQRPLQHTLLHHGGLLLVQHPEVRRQGMARHRRQTVHVFPQQRGAEGVHRFDIRLIHTEHLTAQMPILR